MRLASVTKQDFVNAITNRKEDSFAKTFVSKADMLGAWERCIGVWDDTELMGAILVTHSKRAPVVANLQLLHTFFAHRGKNVARILCEYALEQAYKDGAEYFRVSSEKPAIEFYKKVGFKFLGEQKSGCQLAMFRVNAPTYDKIDWSVDEVINKAMTKKGKGGCVKLFVEEYKGVALFS